VNIDIKQLAIKKEKVFIQSNIKIKSKLIYKAKHQHEKLRDCIKRAQTLIK